MSNCEMGWEKEQKVERTVAVVAVVVEVIVVGAVRETKGNKEQ